MTATLSRPEVVDRMRHKLVELTERYAFTARVLTSTLELLPELRSWDAPAWLRCRLLELADDAQRLEDDTNRLRGDLARLGVIMQ